jgi:signal transduction histidine kinase
LTHDFDKRSGIGARFKTEMSDGPPRLQEEMEMTLYRIAQEAFNNVEKHSQATRAEVILSSTQSHALLVIRDNGKGFRPQDVSRRESGWGLQNMNERARLLGGSLEVTSSLNKGTSISARIPFANHSKRKAAPAP